MSRNLCGDCKWFQSERVTVEFAMPSFCMYHPHPAIRNPDDMGCHVFAEVVDPFYG